MSEIGARRSFNLEVVGLYPHIAGRASTEKVLKEKGNER